MLGFKALGGSERRGSRAKERRILKGALQLRGKTGP